MPKYFQHQFLGWQWGTEMRNSLQPWLESSCREDALLGSGWGITENKALDFGMTWILIHWVLWAFDKLLGWLVLGCLIHLTADSLVAQMVKNLPAMRKIQVQSLGKKDPLDKRMATHSSILIWRVPWTEELGRLLSMGSQRVGHDWATDTFTFIVDLYWCVSFKCTAKGFNYFSNSLPL